jgi:signal transduction histidine kinase/ActR/RegA family two-component response regulator
MFGRLPDWLFDSSGLTPHGFCLLWEPGLIWTYAVSDIVIGIAYFSIPAALAIFARRRRDLVFRPVFWLFAAFIFLCGTTHFLDVLTLWVPAYDLQAVIKVATAIASVVTAVALWWLLPQALALPSHAQIQMANTALRRSEERFYQAQKMEAVGQLTGGIAHDINNMLQGISGSLEMLERRIFQGRVDNLMRYVGTARRAVDSAAGLTHRMLAFARRQALQPKAVEPDTLIAGMEELVRRTIGPMIILRTALHDGIWSALCDPNQLESALLNLAINGRDAMPAGGHLPITTADRLLTAEDLSDQDDAQPGGYVEIAVSDTGTGMTRDVMSRAFEPFFTTKPTGQGTGLGLSQVYGFVRQSGGFVRLDSTPGSGTTVRIYLPRAGEAGAGPTVPGEAARPSGHDVQETAVPTVLVVDDEELVRLTVVEALRDEGYRVLEAEDGPSGLRIAESPRRIDLLVTDVGLPGLNGRQLADAARERRPRLPILFITGYAGTALEDRSLTSGMEVIRKPFAIDTLVTRIGVLLTDPANRSTPLFKRNDADRPAP